jgi:hypothetical protein
MDVYGCLWVFFVIIFWNWGILTKKVFLERGWVASPGDPTGGPNHFKLFGQAGPDLAKSNKFYLSL